MRAINLIPVDQRRGASAPGRSGGGVYAALGFLAVLLLLVSAFTLISKSVDDKRVQLSRIEQQADDAEAKAGGLQAYTQFTSLREKRLQTVQSLAASRFDWAHALHEVARTLPKFAWLTSLRATVTPEVQVEGGASDPLRKALAAPAIEILGCTTTQGNVARVMSAMRRIDGVQRVSLSSSQKADEAAASAGSSSNGGSTGSGDCRSGSARYPQFSMTVFFTAPPAPAAAAAPNTGAATTTATTTGSAK
jgi:Tfp pilus assembly protein PilN